MILNENDLTAIKILLDIEENISRYNSKNSLILKWFTNNKNKNITLKKKNLPENIKYTITSIYNKGKDINGLSLIIYKNKTGKNYFFGIK